MKRYPCCLLSSVRRCALGRRGCPLATVQAFHSLYEADSRPVAGTTLTNDACSQARELREATIRDGRGGYFHCEECSQLEEQAEATVKSKRPVTFVRQHQ